MASLGDDSSCANASNEAVRLEDFIGEWRDSLGHTVCVSWARQGRHQHAGELDVQLLRHGSNGIRLNVKALGQGQFQCGHFELNVDKSSAEKIVWGDVRSKGKVSVWEREEHRTRARSRSRSPAQSRQNCGCVVTRKVTLRCIDHRPLLPPRSVLHDISTPGAWAPPAMSAPDVAVPEAVETTQSQAQSDAEYKEALARTLGADIPEAAPAKASEIVDTTFDADKVLEDYDKSLTQAEAAAELAQPKVGRKPGQTCFEVSPQPRVVQKSSPDDLQEARTKLLAKHYQKLVGVEAGAKLLVTDMASNLQIQHKGNFSKGNPRDPRTRRVHVAPTGGA